MASSGSVGVDLVLLTKKNVAVRQRVKTKMGAENNSRPRRPMRSTRKSGINVAKKLTPKFGCTFRSSQKTFSTSYANVENEELINY